MTALLAMSREHAFAPMLDSGEIAHRSGTHSFTVSENKYLPKFLEAHVNSGLAR